MTRPLCTVLSSLIAALVIVGTAHAQPRRPDEGGTTVSLGQPPRWLPTTGVVAGVQSHDGTRSAVSELRLGAYTELASRVLGLGGVHAEVYGGSVDTRGNGGARVRVASPFLRLAAGADYSLAVCADDTVAAWGSQSSITLSPAGRPSKSTTMASSPVRPPARISAPSTTTTKPTSSSLLRRPKASQTSDR